MLIAAVMSSRLFFLMVQFIVTVGEMDVFEKGRILAMSPACHVAPRQAVWRGRNNGAWMSEKPGLASHPPCTSVSSCRKWSP